MANVEAILDLLREARRYAATRPDEAARLADEALDALFDSDLPGYLYARIDGNLKAGLRFVRCCPDALRGYCTGAILEIQDYAARARKAEGDG